MKSNVRNWNKSNDKKRAIKMNNKQHETGNTNTMGQTSRDDGQEHSKQKRLNISVRRSVHR
jgi:hypothetical protein